MVIDWIGLVHQHAGHRKVTAPPNPAAIEQDLGEGIRVVLLVGQRARKPICVPNVSTPPTPATTRVPDMAWDPHR